MSAFRLAIPRQQSRSTLGNVPHAGILAINVRTLALVLVLASPAAPPTWGSVDDKRINDCGTNCLYLMFRLCRRSVDLSELRRLLPSPDASGLSMEQLRLAAGARGLTLRGARIGPRDVPLDRAAIILLDIAGKGHFVVLAPAGKTGTVVLVLDFPRPPRAVDYSRLLSSRSWTGKALVPLTVYERAAAFMPWLASLLAIPFVYAVYRACAPILRHLGCRFKMPARFRPSR
ncbi:MAG: cysteine peptidase family C39 domain-containing protein [Isosphaeraceae bacterium]